MEQELNELGQPIGQRLENWQAPPYPEPGILQGRHCRLEPLDPERHGCELYAANQADTTGASWTYLPYGPFESEVSYRDWLETVCDRKDPLFYTIVDSVSEQASGLASYLRITPDYGFIEVGHIHYSPGLKRTTAATEAMYLMMRQAFELGYRRYEWKCDALNAPSRRAAERLGFQFEGIFRQHLVNKGRNRDTAWYAIIDSDWPGIKQALEQWLSDSNFDKHGNQRTALSQLIPS
ncbi:MAG: GNAT family N-acetyltransferase [Gammaproteobacteria bacterium]|nr:GNAT family N-acetyltransferase [Gammaproteobacteria bacterium]